MRMARSCKCHTSPSRRIPADKTYSCIFMACVFVYVIILTILGPEYKGRKMDAASDQDLQEARGIRGAAHDHDHSGSDEEKNEKV